MMARIGFARPDYYEESNVRPETGYKGGFEVPVAETGEDVRARFVERFGEVVCHDGRHVDLSAALKCDLAAAGVSPERISCADACTKCAPERYYSFRAEGGVCGRHGAVAFRKVG